jgi:hypothetical protein
MGGPHAQPSYENVIHRGNVNALWKMTLSYYTTKDLLHPLLQETGS